MLFHPFIVAFNGNFSQRMWFCFNFSVIYIQHTDRHNSSSLQISGFENEIQSKELKGVPLHGNFGLHDSISTAKYCWTIEIRGKEY